MDLGLDTEQPPAPAKPSRSDPLSDQEVLRRYKRAMQDAQSEHKRVVREIEELYAAYGLNSFKRGDFADLKELWKCDPPEIGILLSAVNTFWGSMISSRPEPAFPGFDEGTGDAVLGEAITQLVKAGRRWAGSDDVDEDVVLDAVLGGYGWARLCLETETRPPYHPDEEFVSADRVWWDAGGHGKNLGDSQEIIVRDYFSLDEAEARFPDQADLFAALRLQLGGGGSGAAPREGVQAMGGQNIQVTINAVDGRESSSTTHPRRLREVPVDDFQFKVWEQMVGWYAPDQETGKNRWHEVKQSDFDAAMERMAVEGELAAEPFEPPDTTSYPTATWYRARILAATAAGEPRVLREAAPIDGNQRLARPMCGYKERYTPEGSEDLLRTRYFGFGRVLVGLQRLFSVAMRLYIEQEARRNRDGWDVERSAFGGDDVALQNFINSRRIPGSVNVVPDGAYEKLHKRDEQPKAHTSEIQGMFRFMAGDLVSYSLGVSDVSRGTFTEDRSAKWISALQNSALQMQQMFTQARTSFLQEGAVTMARLMLLLLDPQDIDRILGEQPLRKGITGQVGQDGTTLEPIMTTDPETGQQVPMTLGRYLHDNQQEIMSNDIVFGLRPSAASERLANAQLMLQHGVYKDIADLLSDIPEAKEILAPAVLRASFAEGSDYADVADKLDAILQQKKQEREQQQQLQTDQGVLQYLQQKAQQDPQGAQQLLQQAMATTGGQGQQGGQQQPGQAQGGGKPPAETINFKDLPPNGKVQLAAQAGIQLNPADVQPPPTLAGMPPASPGGPIQ